MRITLFAATGGIGRHVLDQALAAGHHVTVVVRDPRKLPDTGATVLTADLSRPDPDALAEAVAGADAVISGLGARSRADARAGIVHRGTRAITAAMRAAGTRRLLVVSAAPVGTVAAPGRPRPPRHDPGDGFGLRHLVYPVLKRILRDIYVDLATMEAELRDSGLDWTSVRPTQLTGHPLTGRYRTAPGRNLPGGRKVGRADVAHYLLRALDDPDTIGRPVGVSY
ncbi:NAD(P)-binding oxidoreductase [Longispora sp. K20-0274]|uniref:NAD(P)-dependent oxidoreductase n=1 Tax=Longispora sp. K20-0274 TaxID=3088255 RepID=UPI00399BB5C1